MNFEGVAFKETENDGTVMVATKAFKRGDILFKEKPLLISKDLSYREIEELEVVSVPDRFPGMLKAFCAMAEIDKKRVLDTYDRAHLHASASDFFMRLNLLAKICKDSFKWAQSTELSNLVKISMLTSRCFTNGDALCLYEFSNRIRHSCEPNCTIVEVKNMTASVVSLCDINIGDEITYSFVDGLLPKLVRSYKLRNRFGVLCERLCCTNVPPFQPFLCDQCSSSGSFGEMVLRSSQLGYNIIDGEGHWKCDKCGSKSEPEQLQYQPRINQIVLGAIEADNVIDILRRLVLLAKTLGFKHSATVVVAKRFIDANVDLVLDNRMLAVDALELLVSVADLVLDYCQGKYDLFGGELLLNLAILLTVNGRYDDALRFAQLYQTHMVCLYRKTRLTDILSWIFETCKRKARPAPQIHRR